MRRGVVTCAALLALALPAPAAKWPPDVARYEQRRAGCNHWAGEEGYDKARQAEINRNVAALDCRSLDADERALKRRYRHSPPILRRIRAAQDALL